MSGKLLVERQWIKFKTLQTMVVVMVGWGWGVNTKTTGSFFERDFIFGSYNAEYAPLRFQLFLG